jgi:SAM-dependent methyltransferase
MNGGMAPEALYDGIAEWYETDFLGGQIGDPLRIHALLRDLLGTGEGPCLEIGCGTGAYAEDVRSLGWTPLGLDLSGGMLRYARERLPVGRADAEALPVPDRALGAVVTVMTHTDMPGYPRVLHEIARVLRPGGVFVHIGVHPCFCGGFADRSDPDAVVIRPGYLDGHWTRASWTDAGVRHRVGAVHRSLPDLLDGFFDAGLAPERFAEGGGPAPAVLAVRARRATP